VVSFDHLHLGYLGCYGNDWIETPHLDRLATQSVVFDWHFAENLDPAARNHAWWTGTPQAHLAYAEQQRQPTWLAELNSAGIETHLLAETDADEPSPPQSAFARAEFVDGREGLDASEHETPFARLVTRADACLRELARADGSWLLWLKSRGVPSPPIPPREFFDLYFDEFSLDDAEPRDESEESNDLDRAATAIIPDELRQQHVLYATCVSHLDRWLGQLLKSLDDAGLSNQVLVVITAAAGDHVGGTDSTQPPLTLEEGWGEGSLDNPLTESLIHTPLIVRDPLGDIPGSRCREFVQTTNLPATLLDWFGRHCHLGTGIASATHTDVYASGEECATGSASAAPANDISRSLLMWTRSATANEPGHPLLRIGCGDQLAAVRTRDHFCLRDQRPTRAGTAAVRLFEKPHDRWDLLDVAREYPAVVEQLLSQFPERIHRS
jgi:arylsulfatase A-like enzyme